MAYREDHFPIPDAWELLPGHHGDLLSSDASDYNKVKCSV